MNIKEFNQLLAAKRKELDSLMRRKLPIKVGAMAKAEYQDNIAERQGFRDTGVTAWPKTRRQQSGSKSAAANYGALLSSRRHLYSSMSYVTGDYRVKVYNYVPYASIHNNGGTTSPTVTSKMRRFAWAMYYKEAGIKKGYSKKAKISRIASAPESANVWKRLALTRKQKLSIRILQRQFLGESQYLSGQIRQTIDSEIRQVLNN